MANELIPVTAGTIGTRATLICNARDLHTFLEVGRDFSTWICKRIAEYGFVEGEDFTAITAPPIRGAGNRGSRTEYQLSIDMAKELGMVERTEQGRKIRRYFIALEAKKLTGRAVPRAKASTALQATPRQPLALPNPYPALPPEMLAAIDARTGQIIGACYAEIRQWLIKQASRSCLTIEGKPAPNFENTLRKADFSAFSTQHASRNLEHGIFLLKYLQEHSSVLLQQVYEKQAELSLKDET